MELKIKPTEIIEMIEGQECRRWEGVTDQGTPVRAWIKMVQPQTHDKRALEVFDADLKELPVCRVMSYDYRKF